LHAIARLISFRSGNNIPVAVAGHATAIFLNSERSIAGVEKAAASAPGSGERAGPRRARRASGSLPALDRLLPCAEKAAASAPGSGGRAGPPCRRSIACAEKAAASAPGSGERAGPPRQHSIACAEKAAASAPGLSERGFCCQCAALLSLLVFSDIKGFPGNLLK